MSGPSFLIPKFGGKLLEISKSPKTKPKTSSTIHHTIYLSTIHHIIDTTRHLHSSTRSTRSVARHYYPRHLRLAAMPILEGATRTAFLLFFLTHIPITLVIDGQAFFPRHYYPQVLRDVVDWYASTFKVRIRLYFIRISALWYWSSSRSLNIALKSVHCVC